MISLFTVFVSVLHLAQPHAGFDCYCNLNHPEGLVFNCPEGKGFPIAILRTPTDVINYRDVNLQTPYCVPKLVNIQAQGTWIPVYVSGSLGYLNFDADYEEMKCPGMLAFNPNKLIVSNACQHNITSVPGLSITGVPTTPPWNLIPHVTATPAPMTTVWHLIPHVTSAPTPAWQHVGGTSVNQARCYGPDIEIEVKQGKTIFYSLTRFCASNGAAMDEVTAIKYCSAPEPTMWKQGKQISGNCASLTKYTPLSYFNGGQSTGDGTAIFMECTKTGNILVVRQTCKSKSLELVEIVPTVDLFVVEW